MQPIHQAARLVLVTGGSGGIGSAVARRLARDGAHVIVHYGTGSERAHEVVAGIEAAGGHAQAIGADLGLRDGAMSLIAQLDGAFGGAFAGRLDVLVNNAGTLEFGSLTDTDDESFDRLFTVNVRAVFQLSREAARRMTASGWGRIINIGSVFGAATPAAGLATYSGTKAAVHGLSRAWSRDLGASGITVNTVAPALIQEDPLPTSGPAFEAMKRFSSVERFGKPDDVAEAVAFLAGPGAAYISGATLMVDGGWSA